MGNIIQAQNLTKIYGTSFKAVDDISLQIEAGRIFGLLGPNGAGKSTVILMILGLTEPTSGTIAVDGYNSTREPLKVKRITGYLPEKVGFYEDMTARANLAYTAALNAIPESDVPKKIDEALCLVGLAPNRNQPVKTFSKGMKQRLGIADVLIKDPRLVIFDEPTEGLDVKVANQILETILTLNSEKGITFLLSSHQLNLVQKICSEVAILSKGRLAGKGTIEDLSKELFGGGKFRIEIELAGVPAGIAAEIESIPGVVSVSGKGNALTVISDKDLRQEISKMVASRAIMTKMNLKQDALEEIYLRYFKEEERA